MSIFISKKALSAGRQAICLDDYANRKRSYEFLTLYWPNIKENAIPFSQKKTRGVEYLPMPESKFFPLPGRMRIVYLLREWVKETEIKRNEPFHPSRHTFATLRLSQGVDLYTVSTLLGKTTRVYAKLVGQCQTLEIGGNPPYAGATEGMI